MDLKTILTLGLHLVKTSLYKACDYLCSGREVVNQSGVLLVVHLWRSSNAADEIGGHMDLHASNPSEDGIADSLVDIGVELSHQLCFGWTTILHHLSPTLGFEYCPNVWSVLIEACHHCDSAPIIVILKLTVGFILVKTGTAIDKVYVV
jgi:hypothetical protein